MARKKRKKKFTAAQVVREMARERVGSPRPASLIPDKRKNKPEKHKPTMRKLLEGE